MADGKNKTSLRFGGGAARPGKGPLAPRAGFGLDAWRAGVMTAVWFVLLVAVLIRFPLWHTFPTEEGALIRTEVLAPAEVSVNDDIAQKERLALLYEHKPQVWIYDRDVASRSLQRLHSFFQLLNDENPGDRSELEDFSRTLIDQNNIALDSKDIWQFSRKNLAQLAQPLSQDKLQDSLEDTAENLLNSRRIVAAGAPAAYDAQRGSGVLRIQSVRGEEEDAPPTSELLVWKSEARDELLNRRLPAILVDASQDDVRAAAANLLIEVLEPNLRFDSDRTESMYLAELKRVNDDPVTITYKPGEQVAAPGQRIDSVQAQALARINEISIEQLAIRLVGLICITAIFFGAIYIYLQRFRNEVNFEPSMVSLMALPPLLAVAFAQALAYVGVPDRQIVLWFPSAMVGMLCTVLVIPQVAFIAVLATACLFAEATGKGLDFLIYALFSGFAAVLAIRSVRSRGEVLAVGLRVGVVNAVTILVLLALRGTLKFDAILAYELTVGFANAILCVPATLFLLWIFEQLFGVVTDFSLLELSGLKNPLIAELEDRAPGTYQHVLNVTKLAEAAAEAIGANYLLVRAGAYFHDLGKMVKPKYYSENQVTPEDKKLHGKLTPNMSTLVIKNHVKEGIEIARRANLPPKVIDFIPQHHGTGLIKYFYYEAMRRNEESEGMDRVNENDFRYPGPKPQMIETAIVMLADSVEAVAAAKFSGSQVNEHELRLMVQDVTSDRFNDGQFDECDLTLRDLYLIREAFVRTLVARYHFRIMYPKAPASVKAAEEKPGPTPVRAAG